MEAKDLNESSKLELEDDGTKACNELDNNLEQPRKEGEDQREDLSNKTSDLHNNSGEDISLNGNDDLAEGEEEGDDNTDEAMNDHCEFLDAEDLARDFEKSSAGVLDDDLDTNKGTLEDHYDLIKEREDSIDFNGNVDFKKRVDFIADRANLRGNVDENSDERTIVIARQHSASSLLLSVNHSESV